MTYWKLLCVALGICTAAVGAVSGMSAAGISGTLDPVILDVDVETLPVEGDLVDVESEPEPGSIPETEPGTEEIDVEMPPELGIEEPAPEPYLDPVLYEGELLDLSLHCDQYGVGIDGLLYCDGEPMPEPLPLPLPYPLPYPYPYDPLEPVPIEELEPLPVETLDPELVEPVTDDGLRVKRQLRSLGGGGAGLGLGGGYPGAPYAGPPPFTGLGLGSGTAAGVGAASLGHANTQVNPWGATSAGVGHGSALFGDATSSGVGLTGGPFGGGVGVGSGVAGGLGARTDSFGTSHTGPWGSSATGHSHGAALHGHTSSQGVAVANG